MVIAALFFLSSCTVVMSEIAAPQSVVQGAFSYFQAAEAPPEAPLIPCPIDNCPDIVSYTFSSDESRLWKSQNVMNFFDLESTSLVGSVTAKQIPDIGTSIDFEVIPPPRVPVSLAAPPNGTSTPLKDVIIPSEFDALFCESASYFLSSEVPQWVPSVEWRAKDVVFGFFLPKNYCSLKLFKPCPSNQACAIHQGFVFCEERTSSLVEETKVTPPTCLPPDQELIVAPAEEDGIRWQNKNSFVQADISFLRDVDVELSLPSGDKIPLASSNGAGTLVASSDTEFSIASWERDNTAFSLSMETKMPETTEGDSIVPRYTVSNLHLKQGATTYSLFNSTLAMSSETSIQVPEGFDGFFCSQVSLELLSEDRTSAILWSSQNLVIAAGLLEGFDACDLALYDPCPTTSCSINQSFDEPESGVINCVGFTENLPPPAAVQCQESEFDPITRTETLQIKGGRSYFKGDNVRVQRGQERAFVGAGVVEGTSDAYDRLDGLGVTFGFEKGAHGSAMGSVWQLSYSRFEDARLDLPSGTVQVPSGFNAFHCDQISLDYGLTSTGDSLLLQAEDVTLAAFLPFNYEPCEDITVFNPCRGEGKLCQSTNGDVSCFGAAPASPRASQGGVICATEESGDNIFERPIDPEVFNGSSATSTEIPVGMLSFVVWLLVGNIIY